VSKNKEVNAPTPRRGRWLLAYDLTRREESGGERAPRRCSTRHKIRINEAASIIGRGATHGDHLSQWDRKMEKGKQPKGILH